MLTSAVEIGLIIGAIFAGAQLAYRKLRSGQVDSITTLARDLRGTPNPANKEIDNLPDGAFVLAALGQEVRKGVEAGVRPLEKRLAELEQTTKGLRDDVELLMDSEARTTKRLNEHSTQIETVERDITGRLS